MPSTSYSRGEEPQREWTEGDGRNALQQGLGLLFRLLAANRDAAALGLLSTLVLVFSWPVAIQGLFPGSVDFVLQYYPNLVFLTQSLRAGEVPLWNPLIFAGTPYLADPQAAVLYLPNWPFILLLDTANVVRAIVVSHYLLATLSSYAYLRVIRLPPGPAIVGAAVYGLSEYTLSQASSMPILVNLAWIPASLVMLELALQRRSLGWAAGAGVALAMQLYNGWLPGCFITAIAVGSTLLWHTVSRCVDSRDWRPALDVAKASAVTGLVWAGLGSALLLPALEFISQSNYSVERSLESSGGVGNVTVLALLGIGGSEGHGAYIGGVGLLLMLFGALFPNDRRRASLYIALGSLSLLAAFGTNAPLYAYLYHWVPGFQTFHGPGRLMVLFLLSASVLTAFGAEAFCRRVQKGQLLATVATVALLLLALYPTMFRMIGPESFRALAENLVQWSAGPYLSSEIARHIFLAGLLGSILLGLRGSNLLPDSLAHWSVLVLLTLDLLIIQGLRGHYFVPPQEVLRVPSSVAELSMRAQEGEPFRVSGYPRDGNLHYLSDFPSHLIPELLPPNMAMVYGVEDTQGYNPLQLRRYAEYLAAINGGPDDYHIAFIHNFQSKLVDMLNLEYVALRVGESRLRDTTLATGLTLEPENSVTTVYPTRILTSTLQVHSYIGHSADMVDGEVAARLRVRDGSGREEVFDLRAGIETAEWAYDWPNVIERVKHSRARTSVTLTFPRTVHTYVASLSLREPMEIAEITLERVAPGIFIEVPELVAEPLEPTSRYELEGEIGDARLYRNNLALPRALLVPRATLLRDPSEVLARLQSEDFDPNLDVVLEGPAIPGEQWAGDAADSQATGDARLIYRTNNTIRLSVQASSYGFLLLNELSYPGWKAYLDGHEVRLWRANYLFRAIELPPGEHEVEYRFEPDSLKLGLAVTLPTLTILLAAAVLRLKTRNRFIGRRLTMIDRELLEILACPACKSPVAQEGDWIVCQNSENCGKRYPVRDGIPIMLIDEAVDPHTDEGAES